MILSISFLSLLTINCVLCEQCVLDNGSQDLNEEIKLKKKLLTDHNIFQSPPNSTSVRLRFQLKYFYFDVNEEVFTLYSWILLMWIDDRLKWDPKDYGDISKTQFSSFEIWMPKFKRETDILYDDYERIYNTMCDVSSSGNVMCFSPISTRTECNSNLINWPYDTQICSFKFGIGSNYRDNFVLNTDFYEKAPEIDEEHSQGWNIVDFDNGENTTCDTQFYLNFVVERQAASLGAITIFPGVLLSVLTASSLFLDVGTTRVGIAILSLLCHIYIQIFINTSIISYNSTTPSILRFVITSLIITTLTIILTFALSCIIRRKSSPQQWIVSVNEYIINSHMKYVIWPRWKSKILDSATDESKQVSKVWIDFANIVNSGSIIIVIIVYISILSSLMPKQMAVKRSY